MGKTKFTKTKPKKGESRTAYTEAKQRCNLTLTPSAIASLDKTAQEQDISRSELVERYARDPLAFLEWTRSRIELAGDWAIFYSAVEASIFTRLNEPELFELSGLAVLAHLKAEDLLAGLVELEKIQTVENATNNVLS